MRKTSRWSKVWELCRHKSVPFTALKMADLPLVFGVFHQSVYSRLDLVNPRFYLILQVLYPKKLSLALVEFL
ncbi:hypothetical protein GW17_00048132 [Ensete ventricosum]|nr:hypothetical protein GW17_00048132 [Ensete ventricosum]